MKASAQSKDTELVASFQFHNISIEEELRVLEAIEIIEALFDKERARAMKADSIALEIKSHALLS